MSSSTSTDWEAIGRTANALILYHPASHALSIQRDSRSGLLASDVEPPAQVSLSLATVPSLEPSENEIVLARHTDAVENPPDPIDLCPYCYQQLPPSFNPSSSHSHQQQQRSSIFSFDPSSYTPAEIHPIEETTRPHDPTTSSAASTTLHRTPPYFRILEKAHDVASRPSTPPGGRIRPLTPSEGGPSARASPAGRRRYTTDDRDEERADEVKRGADGYYSRFFVEEKRLGMGAEGSVFLCQHVLEGNPLGHYAVKKIAVGSSSPYLFKMLREVRLLEALRHPNIIPYHHVWIETTKFSSFGPPIAALHVLMMYANSGNLDTFIESRYSPSPATGAFPIHNADSPSPPLDAAEMKRRFRTRRASSKLTRGEGAVSQEQMRTWEEERRAVMLLSKEEVGSLFGDVVRGLAFLHSNSILHLDLKCSNVLLHLRDGQLIPTAMISDFGTSEEMLHQKRERTGHTGTMEYMAPETVFPDPQGTYRQTDSTADMWSLGLILHKMLFFRLPYDHDDTFTELERQIAAYKGFSASQTVIQACERRGLPRQVLTLLERLVSLDPRTRPTAEKALKAWSEMNFDIVNQPRPSDDRLQVGLARSSWIRDPPSPIRPIKNIRDSSSSSSLELLGEQGHSRSAPVDNPSRVIIQNFDMTVVKILVAVLKIATVTPIRSGSFPRSLAYYCILILAAYDLTQSSYRMTLALLVAHLALSVALKAMGGSTHQLEPTL